MRIRTICSAVLTLLVAGTTLTACAETPDSPGNEAIGTASLALVGTSASGATYKLTGVVFTVTGPTARTLQGDTDVVTVQLPVGYYNVKLETGWAMQKLVNGVYQPISATLSSTNPQGIYIYDQSVSTVSFNFLVEGESVEIGNPAGALNVNIGITETPSNLSIDNVEDGDLQIRAFDGRQGAWFTFADETATLPSVTPVSPGADGSAFCMEFAGDYSSGENSGVGLTLAGGAAYDASRFSGISFKWREVENSWGYIYVDAITTDVLPVSSGGTCEHDCNPYSAYLYFGWGAPWQTVSFSWLNFSPSGNSPLFDPAHLVSLRWRQSYVDPYILHIDDVAFLPN